MLMRTYIPLIVLGSALQHGTLLAWPPSAAGMSGHDLAVLADWVVGGLLVSLRFFAWDPHRPGHARAAEASTTLRSA